MSSSPRRYSLAHVALLSVLNLSLLAASSPAGTTTGCSNNNNNTCTLPCASTQVCVADPEARCVTPHGSCGGFIGAACADTVHDICVDDPRDDCDPDNGGADCIGICVLRPGAAEEVPDCDDE